MRCGEIQIGGNSFRKIRYFLRKSLNFVEKLLISANILTSANSAKKAHVFRKGISFLRILRKRHTFPKGELCIFSQEFTKCPRQTHKFTKCSRTTHMFRKRVSCLRILQKRRTFPKGGIYRFSK